MAFLFLLATYELWFTARINILIIFEQRRTTFYFAMKLFVTYSETNHKLLK